MRHFKLTKLLQKPGLILLISTVLFLILINKVQFLNEKTFDPPSNGLGNQCHFVNLKCEIELAGQFFHVILNKEVEVEERISITIASSDTFTIEEITIQGINMYMGVLPVIEENVSSVQWQGWFMLGACSESPMRWRMSLKVKGSEKPGFLTFTTI